MVEIEALFLREKASRMFAVMRDFNAPLPNYRAAVVHYVEFSVAADEIEEALGLNRKPPKRKGTPYKPLARQDRFEPEPYQTHQEEHESEPEGRRVVFSAFGYQGGKKRAPEPLEPLERPPVAVVDRKHRQIERETPVDVRPLVKSQGGKCAYCLKVFGSRVFKPGKIVTLHAVAEHFVPKSAGGEVLYASCQICNLLKSNYLFDSIEECREWLAKAWKRSRYQDANGHFLACASQFSSN